MPTLTTVDFLLTGLDIVVLALVLINLILLVAGMGKFGVFNAIDAVIYLFKPKLAITYDYKKFFPKFTKDQDGNIAKAFGTNRDECYPVFGALHERLGDFLLRIPLFSVLVFLVSTPLINFYFDTIGKYIASYYPLFSTMDWTSAHGILGRLFIVLFFLPFSSVHAAQLSAYALIVFPLLAIAKALSYVWKLVFWFFTKVVPFSFFLSIFLILFSVEILINYVGFLPMFHKGIIPFLDSAPGLKQFVFWMPIKFKIYLDLVLIPLVVVIPFITSVGSYILAKADAQKKNEEVNFMVLFYKTGIAYLYAPILGGIFTSMKEESKIVRSERRINEILVLCMYLESFVCVAGTGYAYYSVAKAANLPMSGIVMGLVVLLTFVPMMVFSTNGFQSHFLDIASHWGKRVLGKEEVMK